MDSASSHDLGQETAGQMGELGKKAGGKLARKAAGKVGKVLKKMLMNFLKQVVLSIGKALLATLGPWGLAILAVVLAFLAILASIPGADWFQMGGKRTADQVAADQKYEQQFRQKANESVQVVDSYRALPNWRTDFMDLIKPSWGIPSALARYELMKQDDHPVYSAGDLSTFSKTLNPTLTSEPIDPGAALSVIDNIMATAYGPDCGGCSGITATGINVRTPPVPKIIAVDPRVIPLHSEVELIDNGTSMGVFYAEDTGGAIIGKHIDILYPSEAESSTWGVHYITVKILKMGGSKPSDLETWSPSGSHGVTSRLPSVDAMYEQLKPVFHYKTISDDIDRWKIVTTVCGGGRCYTSTDYQTQKRASHQVLDWVWTPYGDIHVNTLKKYWTAEEPDQDWRDNKGSLDKELYTLVNEYPETGKDNIRRGTQAQCKRTESDEEGGGSTTVCTYYQYENTEVDDSGLPSYQIDSARLRGILLNRGVKENDVPIIFQFAAAADESHKDVFFYAGQFDGVNPYSNYTDYQNLKNLPPDFKPELKDGWCWPVVGNHTITDTMGARWGTYHYGMDLGGTPAEGMPVVAAHSGRVIRAEFSSSYGNVVYLLAPDGIETRYAHMQNHPLVSVGQTIGAGTQLGSVGRTGGVTGPHLHFEVLWPGNADPMMQSKDMDYVYDPMIFLGPLK
jgi:murein DD-endopeptidase MepM/ murein hydrolase activator NlpD/3D (Asp-Asp-Asp) domain-containing protein